MASRVPRRSTTPAIPAIPMATSVTPLRHGAPEGVRDHDAHGDPEQSTEGCADPPRRAVGIEGQQGRGARVDVGEVDAGVGTDEPVARLGDEQLVAAAQDPHRLGLDQGTFGSRIVRVDGHEPTLGLGDHLLGDHHHVTVADPSTRIAVTTASAPASARASARSAARSSPGRTSPMPVTGRMVSAPGGATSDGGTEHDPGQGG